MAYKADLDKTLWETDPVEFKPQSTIKIEIKSYDGGEPKIQITEEGIGWQNKPFTSPLLKRVNFDDYVTIVEMLQEQRDKFEELTIDWHEKNRR